MEEEDVVAGLEEAPESPGGGTPRRIRYAGSFRRLLFRGVLLGIVAAVVALQVKGSGAALGTAAGCLAAAVYCWGYLRSHVGHAGRARIFDPALAWQSAGRIGALALAGVGIRLLGREPFLGYLVGFAVAFGVLVALEAPAVARHLRANGLMG